MLYIAKKGKMRCMYYDLLLNWKFAHGTDRISEGFKIIKKYLKNTEK